MGTSTEVTPQQGLIAKIVTAAKESGYVQKASKHGQGYKYADDEAITTKFRDALLSQGLVMFPEEVEIVDLRVLDEEPKPKTPNVLVAIRGYFTVADGGATLRVASLGQGLDRGDKGVYKAMTGFKKYAYRHLVMMATGDDPEQTREDEQPPQSTGTSSRRSARATEAAPGGAASGTQGGSVKPSDPASREQQDELKSLAAEHGLTKEEMSVLRQAHTDKERSSQFTVADYEAMKAAIVATGAVKAAAGEGAVIEK